ncbi:MAG: hypothetical protein KF760_05895 [Candidatus Eremiobacteraeota bacterium]|nr:hypothetical protein [Candidatus Eremiobacteraeota bacterium]MCW5867073.1 hypothetical protein [Candidatus Eremiobacteraeota bacterium]
MRNVLAAQSLLLSFILVGCGGGSSGTVASGGNSSTPVQNNPAPTQSPPVPAGPKSTLQLVLNVVTPRAIDFLVHSFRLSLYSGQGNQGNLVAGPFTVAKDSGPIQTINWPSLPTGNYSFHLELLDASGNLRGTFLRSVELTADQTLTITDPAWLDATQPPPQANSFPAGARPQVQRTEVTGTLDRMVLDAVRQRVYISNTSANQVEVYDLNQRAMLPAIACGGSPQGLDLSADGRYLVVCPSAESKIQMIDLTTALPTPVDVPMPPPRWGTNRPRYVACAANGKAFFGCVYNGSGFTDMWELDLASQSITRRTERLIDNPTYIRASGDRKTLAFAEGNSSGGEIFLYDSDSNTFGPVRNAYDYQKYVAVNSVGTRFLFSGAYFDVPLRRQGEFSNQLVDFAYDGSDRFGFGAAFGRSQVDWVDVRRQQCILSIDLSANPIQLICLSNGRRLVATTANGLEDVQLPANVAPQVEALERLAVPIGGDGSVTLQAYDPEGDTVRYEALALPNGAQLDSNTGVLRFRPSGGEADSIAQATISVHDGVNSSNVTVPLQILARDSATTVLPIAGELSDLYFDAGEGILYATNRAKNRVERVRVQGPQHLRPIAVGSRPQGLDRVPSTSQLLVCRNDSEYLEVVDTSAAAVNRSILVPSDANAYDRPYSVGVSNAGRVLVGLDYPGTGSTVPREVNLNGDVVTQRSDLGRISEPYAIQASGDRGRLALASGSRGYLVDAALANLQTLFITPYVPPQVAGDIDGSRWLSGGGPHLFQPGNFDLGTVVPQQLFYTWRGGRAYGHNATTTITRIDLDRFAAEREVILPVQPTGAMALNEAEDQLFVICQGGIAVVRLAAR